MARLLEIQQIEKGDEKLGIIFDASLNSFVLRTPMYYLKQKSLSSDKITKETNVKLRTLFRAWSKFCERNKKSMLISGSNDEGTPFYDFQVVLDIIKDFSEFGLFVEHEKIHYITNCGKIDFKKTVQKVMPQFYNSSIYFNPFCSIKKKQMDESTLRNIQSAVLNEISQQLGWMIGFATQFPISKSIKLDKNSVLLLNVLKQSSFNSRKLHLIDLLINYIQMVDKSKEIKNGKLVVCQAFSFWEDMVSQVIGSVTGSVLERFYVRHSYVEKSTLKRTFDLKPLRPDSVSITTDGVAILDAKYYPAHSKPDNESISKQFIYLYKAKRICPTAPAFSNVFVVPTSDNTHVSSEIAVFDYDILPIITNDEKIKILKFNVDDLVNAYVSNKKFTSTALLF